MDAELVEVATAVGLELRESSIGFRITTPAGTEIGRADSEEALRALLDRHAASTVWSLDCRDPAIEIEVDPPNGYARVVTIRDARKRSLVITSPSVGGSVVISPASGSRCSEVTSLTVTGERPAVGHWYRPRP